MAHVAAGGVHTRRPFGISGQKLWALSGATSAAMNTAFTNSLGPDGFTWAGVNASFAIDTHSNLIVPAENASGAHTFSYRNASSGVWADASLSESFLVRGTAWLDSVHNFLHVLWTASVSNGGVVYRRYVVNYAGSDITDIVSDSTVGTRTNVVLDDGAGLSAVEQPALIPLPDIGGTYGALVAVWAAQSATGGEIRAAMLTMGSTATAGQTLANWVAPVTASTTSLGATTTPAVGSYSALYSTTDHAELPYFAITRRANKDLALAHADGKSDQTASYRFRRATWNAGTSNWSTGLTTDTLIYANTRSGTNTGYTEKAQLITAIAEDGAGNCFVGLASWNGNANGDTVGIAKVDPSGVVTTLDVNSAGGAHSNAPVVALGLDPTKQLLIITYTHSSDNFAYGQLVTPALTKQGSEITLFTTATNDGVTFVPGVTLGTKAIGVLRNIRLGVGPPYTGYEVDATWQ